MSAPGKHKMQLELLMERQLVRTLEKDKNYIIKRQDEFLKEYGVRFRGLSGDESLAQLLWIVVQ